VGTFDFVASDEFRRCLEKDAEELVACMKAGAWKAAHVIAASLIQAAVVEYMVSSGKAAEEDVLGLPFSGLLSLCRAREVLTSRTVDLASFIRPYTESLSPSSRVRLQAGADETSARIAQALLEIVVNEVSSHQKENYRFNAEQVVAKLQSDPSSSAIIGHLVGKISRVEMERLLLELIPMAYFETARLAEPRAGDVLKRLENCYRTAFSIAPADLKKAAAAKFVQVLENESEYVVQCYESAFFRGSDLAFLDEESRAIVKAHFLASLDKRVTDPLLAAAAGMGEFLESEEEARAFFVPLFVSLLAQGGEALSAAIARRIREEFEILPDPQKSAILGLVRRLRRSTPPGDRGSAALASLESNLAGLPACAPGGPPQVH
jgi:hypothetical protein